MSVGGSSTSLGAYDEDGCGPPPTTVAAAEMGWSDDADDEGGAGGGWVCACTCACVEADEPLVRPIWVRALAGVMGPRLSEGEGHAADAVDGT